MQPVLDAADGRDIEPGRCSVLRFSGAPWPEPLRVKVHLERDRVGVAPVGELDLANAGLLDERLRGLDDASRDRFVLDLHQVSLMHCSGRGVRLGARQRARQPGNRLDVRGARGEVTRLLALTGVEREGVAHRFVSRHPVALKAGRA